MAALLVMSSTEHRLAVVRASPPQTAAAGSRTELIAVTSKDGTRIGVECGGTGPTLLFVHGGVGDRTRWTPMVPLLASRFTVCAMDRRGRGASGDSPDYGLAREAEDVAAVVNARVGPVFVFGHSLGGVAALEAAFLTDRITKLMLYEPPLHEPFDNDLFIAVAARVDEMARKGELEEALVAFQTEIVKQSPEEIARMKTRPTWPGLVASMAVHPRQMRALAAYRFDASRMKSVRMPTLLLIGEDTASPYARQSIAALQESLPNPTLVVLERQEHNAMEAGRDLLANAIIKFADTQQAFLGATVERSRYRGRFSVRLVAPVQTGRLVLTGDRLTIRGVTLRESLRSRCCAQGRRPDSQGASFTHKWSVSSVAHDPLGGVLPPVRAGDQQAHRY
jgi:pimeloyl-ACP methyl ester carboxylesterase